MDNQEHLFYEARPNLDSRQLDLLNCFYQSRRETARDDKIKASMFESFLQSVNYETDMAIYVLQKLDDYYSSLCLEALKRANKNG